MKFWSTGTIDPKLYAVVHARNEIHARAIVEANARRFMFREFIEAYRSDHGLANPRETYPTRPPWRKPAH